MILDKKNTLIYLFENYLLDFEEMGNTSLFEIPNTRSYIIVVSEKFLVKNLKFNDISNLNLFHKEFKFYNLVFKNSQNKINSFLPKLHFFDKNFNIIVYDYIKNGNLDFENYIEPVSKFIDELQQLDCREIELNFKPWIFDFVKGKTELLQNLKLSENTIEKIQLIENKYLFEVCCHGDLKKENILFDVHKRDFYIIDWELYGKGDKYWDCAFFLGTSIIQKIILKKNIFINLENDSVSNYFNIFSDEFKFIIDFSNSINRKKTLEINNLIEYVGIAMIQRICELKMGNSYFFAESFLIYIAEKFISNPQKFSCFFYESQDN